MWLVENGEKMPAFAKRAGIPYNSLHAYVTTSRRITAERLSRVAVATGLPSDYWMDDALPYPPPAEYGPEAIEQARRRLATLPMDLLNEFLEILNDPDDARRTANMRRVSRGLPPLPAPRPTQ